MPTLKVLGILFSLLILGAAPNGQRKVFDENRFPLVDYLQSEPSDIAERAKQRKRSAKYDKSDWGA